MFGIVAQWLAVAFLGIVGLVLAGDFRRWWLYRKHAGNPKLAGLVMLMLYVEALAVFRWVH